MSKRLKFFIKHLTLSLVFSIILLGLLLSFWYQMPLAKAVGVTSIILILFFIDITLGPLLGLLVYKEHKKCLKFDLSIIIIIQIFALLYGVYTLEQGRPVWIAYNVDRFELVRKNELIIENLDQAKTQFQKTSFLRPQYVSVEFSKDKLQRENDMFAEALGGISIAQKPERYVDFIQAIPQIKQQAKNVKELEQYNDQMLVQQILEKYPEATGYIPLKANAVDMTVLVNKETGAVIKIVDLRPWK
ncbi:TfpX/TfpZ family type IV pilin accessory protein [Acinetobacter sp. MF4640]|uniref:TfpX/TfpZ family type IV pilin accessory protein n=1 Tax=Acinetobacter sp. MF4640 TaxID=1960826 RepID=UPI000994A8A9|nr:TfpX/TfpZ family type IV pilin accessory protein [Acinetobacter sp. MF4640]OOW14127.1 type IV pilin accessory protein [Acinetobacter sp. MF4640]